MNYIRAFIAGITLPSVLLPILLCFAVFFQKGEILGVVFVHIIPLIWGVWNILYFALFKRILPGNENTKLLISGLSLGIVIACIGIFWIQAPSLIGLTGNEAYLPLVGVPILYAILWRFVVHHLNHIVGVKT